VEAVVAVAPTGAGADSGAGSPNALSSAMAALVDGARQGGVESVLVGGPDAALAELAPRLQAGDAVLVKASRMAGLERVAAALLDLAVDRVDDQGAFR